MPAKEQIEGQETMSHDEALSNTSSVQGSPKTGLINKIYDAVLSREVVQKGVQRIKTTYHDVLFEGKNQIDGIKRISEGVYHSTKERVQTWAYSVTIYNHFTNLWLIKNLPYNREQIASFEDFLASFQSLSKDITQESEALAKNFYKQAHDVWANLKSSDLEDIKQACLKIAALSISIDIKIDIEVVPEELVKLFNAIDGSKKDIISNDTFHLLLRRRIGSAMVNEADFRRVSDTFYTFARRFAFLEFPLTYANQDLLRVLAKFAKDKLDVLGELMLTRVDSLLTVVVHKLGYEYQDDREREEPMTLLDRYNVILEKIMLVTSESYKRSKLAIQDSQTYKYLDNRIHFNNRYEELALVSNYVYEAAVSAITPAYKAISFTYNKIVKEYVFALAEISAEVVKQNYALLKKKYSILSAATLRLKDNVLEIRINKETFEKLSTEVKSQVALIYGELKTLDSNKLKVYGSEAYKKAIETIRGGVKAITCCGQSSQSTEKKSEDVKEEKVQAEGEKEQTAQKMAAKANAA